MKYISICSGIEAASTAWHGLGWTPLAFSEIEPFPSAVLAERWPQVPNLGDMSHYREWPEEILAECELLVGGSPCQAFSVAGLRRSLDDERGNLSLVYVQLFHHINEVRRRHGRPPAIALWENVPGVLSTKDNAFGCFISGLLGVDDTIETEDGKWPKAGFLGSETVRVGYRILDAQYFGVAQRRRRVFLVAVPCELVANLGERACPSEILSLRESVLGNPPTRGEARQAVAGDAASGAASGGGCGEPYYIDRASFNQGVNAQYDPQITRDGVALSMVARGPAAVAQPCDQVFPCLDANVDAKWGSNQGVDGNQYILQKPMWSASDQANAERLVDQAGTLNCNMGQRGGWIAPSGHPDPAYALSAGNQNKGGAFGSGRDSQDTFVVAFKPGQSEAAGGTFVTKEFAPTMQAQNNGSTAVPAVAFKPSHFTRGKDGKPDDVTPPLSADADKGDQDTVIATSAIGFNWQNGGGYGNANDGLGITEEGTGPLQRCNTPAVAFQSTLGTRGGDVYEDGTAPTVRVGSGVGIPSPPAVAFSAKDNGADATTECSPTMRAMHHVDGNANAGGQIAVVVGVDTYNQTVPDVAIPVRVGNAKDSLPAAMVPADVAAFTQNTRDEVQYINGDGKIAGALAAEAGMKQTTYLAFSPLQGGRSMPVTPESPTLEAGTGNKTPAVVAFKESQSGCRTGEVHATIDANKGSRRQEGVVAFAQNQLGEVRTNGEVMGTVNTNQNASGRNTAMVHQAMQVRRLTPTECCRLQGFPDDHCDITFRKKPAADGPKYRALGNSMAVPCMFWLGWRIQQATA